MNDSQSVAAAPDISQLIASLPRRYPELHAPPAWQSLRWCDGPHEHLARYLAVTADLRRRLYRHRLCLGCWRELARDRLLWSSPLDPHEPATWPAFPAELDAAALTIQERLDL